MGCNDSGERHMLLLKSRVLLEGCRKSFLTLCERIPVAETPLPTQNPQIDLLLLMTLTKLAETNYVLSDWKQVQMYITWHTWWWTAHYRYR
jgi:hypothetical protein